MVGRAVVVAHLSHAPASGVYIITHAQHVFSFASCINVRLCTFVVVVCIYSHLCRLLANLVSNLWCEVVGFFFMWQDVSLCRGALRSFLCCCQKRRPKMVSDSFVTCYSRPGRGIIFTSSFHNVQMSDSSCTVLLFEPSV